MGKENGQQGEENVMARGRRGEGMEKKIQTIFSFFLKKIPIGLIKGISGFYFCNCTFCAKSQIIFF